MCLLFTLAISSHAGRSTLRYKRTLSASSSPIVVPRPEIPSRALKGALRTHGRELPPRNIAALNAG
jgi:hypothetical protein